MNPTKLPKTPTLPGQLGINGNVVSTMVGTSVVPLCNGNTPSYSETDTGYFDASMIPITRVGDNSYLPMDVKADFRGAIQPWAQLPYFLVENDGSVTGLRPGYNGEFVRIFYAYSASGSFAAADMQLTDSEYRPAWLAADEYVSNVIDGNTNGFCVTVKSTVTLAQTRYYWVDHNGTLDSRFHTFLDVTNNMTIAPSGYYAAGPAQNNGLTGGGSGIYIKEASLWVQVHTNLANTVCYTWYTVDRGFQSVRSATVPAAFPAKSVNWQDISNTVAGTSNTSIIFDGQTSANMAKYFKFLNEPSSPLIIYATYPNSGRITLSYAYENGVVRLYTPYVAYIPYTSGATMFAWSTVMDYNVAGNTLRYNPVTDDPQRFQTLPMVVKYNDFSVDSGAVPGTITDAYKANKFPVQSSQTGLVWGNNMTKLLHTGNKIVSMYVGTSGVNGFTMGAGDVSAYAGSTLAAQRMDSLRRPYFNKVPVPYADLVPYDASTLSKNLQYVRFIGPSLLHGYSTSRLYGQALSNKLFKATLPATTTTNTVYSTDSNTYVNCFPVPSAVTTSNPIYDGLGICTIVRQGGAMAVNRASWTQLDATAASWLAVNINPATALPASTYSADPTTFRSKMNEVVALMKAASTLKPTIAITQAVDMHIVWVDETNKFAYFLVNMVWGNYTDGFQFEYAFVRLNLVGTSVVWPSTVSIIGSTISGTKMTGAGNSAQRADLFPEQGSLGVYQGSDNRWFILSNASTFIGIQGGNYGEVRMFTCAAADMAPTASKLFNNPQSWLSYTCGIHPTFGFHYTTCWNDSNAKASMIYYDYRSTADQATRLQNSANDWMAGAGGLQTVFVLSSKSASGFVMYSSEITVLMNGKVGTIPTQTIQLSSIAADPSNKTFLFYVQWNGTSFVLTPSLTAIPESQTSTYVGSVITNATGISSSVIQKVTRIDTFRVHGSETPTGSAIRTLSSFTLTATPPVGAYVRPGQTLTFAATDLVSRETGAAGVTSLGSPVNATVVNNGSTVTYTPGAIDTLGSFTYTVTDSIGNSGSGTATTIMNVPLAPVNALMYATTAAAATARSQYTPPPADSTIDMTVVYDAASNVVWKYTGGAWVQQSGTIQARTGYPVEVYNHLTNERFYVRAGSITGPGYETTPAQMTAWYPSPSAASVAASTMQGNSKAMFLSAVTTDPGAISGNPKTAWRWCREFIVAQDTVVTIRIFGDDTLNVYNSKGVILYSNAAPSQTFTLTKGYNRVIVQNGNGGGTLTYVIFDMVANGAVLSSSNKNEWTLMTAAAGEANTPGMLS